MLNIFKSKEKKADPMTCIFVGRSGCGKGTQVELFKNKLKEINGLKTLHIETGAFLRELAKGSTYTGKITKDTIDNGGLMPESVVIGLWSNYLVKNFSGEENLVFDGVARRIMETKILDGALKFYKISKYKVIYINVSKEWATERLLGRGRKDDSREDIENRMRWFDEDVIPSIEFFKNNKDCEFININGEQTIEQVHAELVGKIFPK